MEIKVYNNVFENESSTFEYNPERPLIDQIEEHINKNVYKENLVECYDSETGETFYAPIENDDSNSVMIIVGNQTVDKDYVPKEGDIVSVFFLPASGNTGNGTVIGGVLGGLVGIVAAVAMIYTGGATLPIVLQAFSVFAGCLSIGMSIGAVIDMKNAAKANEGMKYDSGKEGSASPDIRGAENTSIKGQNFPFVIGKHLVTPFIVGDPITEYSGNNGEEAYIRTLLCVGYAPLKLTDFKLGEFWLAYNRSHTLADGTLIEKDTVLSGVLQGYSLPGDPADSGDILDYWKNNEVELEILQQPKAGTTNIKYVNPYFQSKTVIDLSTRPLVPSDVMHAAGWTEVEDGEICTVYSSSYSNAQENKCVLVTPISPAGSVVTPTELESIANALLTDASSYPYNLLATFTGIDCIQQCEEYAVALHEDQERFYFGTDYTPGESNVNYGTIYPDTCDDQQVNANTFYLVDKALDDAALVVYKGVSFPNKFRTNGVFFTHSCPMEFTITIDMPQGIYESHTHTADNNSSTIYNAIPLWICAQWRIHDDSQASSDSTGNDYNTWNNIDIVPLTTFTESLAYADIDAHKGNDFGNRDAGYTRATQYAANKTYYVKSNGIFVVANPQPTAQTFYSETTYYIKNTEETLAEKVYQGYLGKDLCNLQPYSGENGISQIRLSKTITLTKEQCKQIINDNNQGRLIEVRVIRVSPNYINMTSNSGISDQDSPYQYSDHVKVNSIVTKIFDEQALINDDVLQSVKPMKEEDMRKFCLVAIRAKADTSGYLINQLKKVNCIAESFSPIWDSVNKVMLPENIVKKTIYYGYFNGNNWVQRSNTATERIVSKSEYEEARRMGLNWYEEEAGSNFTDVMKDIVFSNPQSGRYLLTPEAAKYNNNTSASGFMLACVGGQNGPLGMGYIDINILSIADWAEKTFALTDGSTFDHDTVYNGVQYHKGDLIPVRMEANGYVYSGTKLEDILQRLAFTGRAMWCIDENGKIKVIMDAPVDYTVGVINAQNTISSSNVFSFEKAPAGLFISYSDENDGYETNQFYCWGDGNSLRNYHGEVEPYSIQFVTNPYQMWSLGRYMLAYRELGREVLTRKVGPEGVTYKLGDVVLVQSEDLLIGDCSGRVEEIIEQNGIIYGFICNSPFEYTAELDTDGNAKQGVTILQTGHLGKSNAVTIPLSDPRTIRVGGKDYELKKGTTNVILFGKVENSQHVMAYGVERGSSDPSYSSSIKYDIKSQNICMFGIRSKISAPYRITKIKPERDGCFTETLILYDENFYQYGAMIPSFQNYMTPPQPEQPPVSLSEVPSTIKEMNEVNNAIMARVAVIYSNHIVTLYKESDEVLTSTGITSDFIYHFDTNQGEWNGPGSNGWSTTMPVNPTNQIWITTATAYGNTTLDTITASEWASPIVMGMNGTDGYNTVTVSLYKRLPNQPTQVPGDLTYYFRTAIITCENFNGWSTSIPEINEDNDPCWEIHATALSTNDYDVISGGPTWAESEWSEPAKIMADGLTKQDVIDLIGDVQNETPNIYCNPTTGIYAVDEMDTIPIAQSVDFEFKVIQNKEELDFSFGAFDLPLGFSATVSGHTLIITALAGARVKTSYINVPIVFRQYTNNDYLVDIDGNPLVWIACEDGFYEGEIDAIANLPAGGDHNWFKWTGLDTQSTTEVVKGGWFYEGSWYYFNGSIWEESKVVPLGIDTEAVETSRQIVTLTLSTVAGGRYLGPIDVVADIPDDAIIGDFFVWAGEDLTPYTDVQYEILKTGCCYKWTGNGWVVDNSGKHIGEALKDILALDEAKLAANNSDVVTMVRELIAMNVVTQNIHVTGSALIDSTVTAKLTLGSNGYIQSSNYGTNTGFRINANGDAIFRQLKVGTGDGITLIENGKIDTALIDVQQLFAQEITIANKAIVGSGGTIQSANFNEQVTTPSGWRIKSDGTAYFGSAMTINGTITVNSPAYFHGNTIIDGVCSIGGNTIIESTTTIKGKLEGASGSFNGFVSATGFSFLPVTPGSYVFASVKCYRGYGAGESEYTKITTIINGKIRVKITLDKHDPCPEGVSPENTDFRVILGSTIVWSITLTNAQQGVFTYSFDLDVVEGESLWCYCYGGNASSQIGNYIHMDTSFGINTENSLIKYITPKITISIS